VKLTGVVVAIALVTSLTGCTRHKTATSSAASLDLWKTVSTGREAEPPPIEVLTKILPRGRLPDPAAKPTVTSTARTETIPGLSFSRLEDRGVTFLSGIGEVRPTEVAIRDRDGALEAWCVQVDDEDGTDPDRTASFTSPLSARGSRVLAGRMTSGKTPSFTAVALVADAAGRMQRTATETTIPLVPIGSMAGVEAFAFIDEGPHCPRGPSKDAAAPARKPTACLGPMVDVLVRRSPLQRGSVEYAAFGVSQRDGNMAVASCGWVRVPLRLERGNGSSVRVDVGVETPRGARALRVQLGTIWLPSEPEARLTSRFMWEGPERDRLVLTDPEEPRRPNGTDEVQLNN
jgi:hypothetical protein